MTKFPPDSRRRESVLRLINVPFRDHLQTHKQTDDSAHSSMCCDNCWFWVIFRDNLWNWFCFGCTNVMWNINESLQKADSDWYYTSSLIHFNKKHFKAWTVWWPMKMLWRKATFFSLNVLFHLEMDHIIQVKSFANGNSCWVFMLKDFQQLFCCPFHCAMISAGESHQFHFLTPHLRLSLRPKTRAHLRP